MIKKITFWFIVFFILSNSSVFWFNYDLIKRLNLKLWQLWVKKLNILTKKVDKIIEKKYENRIRKNTKIWYNFLNKKLIIYLGKDANNTLVWKDYYYVNLENKIWKLISIYWIQWLLWINNKEALNMLKKIEKEKNKNKYCLNNTLFLYKVLWDILSIKKPNFNITYNTNETQNLIKCYISHNLNKFIFTNKLTTVYHNYRKTNIEFWSQTLKWFYNKWDIINVFNHIKQNANKYVEWYALFSDNSSWDSNWVIAKKVLWWWLCWVSTALYQNLSRIKWMKVLKVYNHQSWWDTYYWSYPRWFDSTVYFSDNWKNAYKNLLIKNEFGNIYIEPFWYVHKWRDFISRNWRRIRWTWYIYWFKVYSLNYPLKILKVKEDKVFKKWSQTCYKIWFYDWNKLLYQRTSCYKTINKKIKEEK